MHPRVRASQHTCALRGCHQCPPAGNHANLEQPGTRRKLRDSGLTQRAAVAIAEQLQPGVRLVITREWLTLFLLSRVRGNARSLSQSRENGAAHAFKLQTFPRESESAYHSTRGASVNDPAPPFTDPAKLCRRVRYPCAAHGHIETNSKQNQKRRVCRRFKTSSDFGLLRFLDAMRAHASAGVKLPRAGHKHLYGQASGFSSLLCTLCPPPGIIALPSRTPYQLAALPEA